MKTFYKTSIDFNLEVFNDYFCRIEAAAAEAGETPDYCLPCSYEFHRPNQRPEIENDPDCLGFRCLAAQAMKGHCSTHGKEIPVEDDEKEATLLFDLGQGFKFYVKLNPKDLYDIFSEQIEAAAKPEINISAWYAEKYPTDAAMAEKIDPEITFNGVYRCIENGYFSYFAFFAGDSVVRERIFSGMAEYFATSYEDIYSRWCAAACVDPGCGLVPYFTGGSIDTDNAHGVITVKHDGIVKEFGRK